jgi:dephospho-CoA kinase
MLVSLGATVVDADLVAHELLRPGSSIFFNIIEAFGAETLNSAGEIDRPRLGARIFAHPEDLARLNALTHPTIWAEILRRVEEVEGDQPVVLMIPLLFEHSRQHTVDEVWVVAVDEEEQLSRLMQRNGYSREEASSRQRSQWSLARKIALAQVVIDNGGTLEQTRRQVEDAWKRFVAG